MFDGLGADLLSRLVLVSGPFDTAAQVRRANSGVQTLFGRLRTFEVKKFYNVPVCSLHIELASSLNHTKDPSSSSTNIFNTNTFDKVAKGKTRTREPASG